MLIVAVAWIYVVGLMALTEASFVAGIMTFLMYCVVPLSILFYLTGGRGRRRRADETAKATAAAATKTTTTEITTEAMTEATTETSTKTTSETTAAKNKQESQDDTR